MCNYFIIEDKSNSISNIKTVLDGYNEFHCVGISNDYNNAMNMILKDSPSLVFLNIDGVIDESFQFVNEINQFCNSSLDFIALSSFKDKAYDTIKNGFFDYLLTPLTELELRKSILSFQKKKIIKQQRNICIKSYRDYRYLNTDEILFLKADNNTTDFYMNDGTTVSAYKTLKTFEDQLPENFIRIHKSYIINENFVSRIQYGKSICTLRRNSVDIPFTKTYIERIEKINESLSKYSSPSQN